MHRHRKQTQRQQQRQEQQGAETGRSGPRRRPGRLALTLTALSALLLAGTALVPEQAKAAESPSVRGHVYAGYQGWFNTPGDGSPIDNWRHWSGSQPAPGKQTFELYPDTSAYPAQVLAPTGYAGLGNGQPARLFSSYPAAVIDQHFDWMRDYGIDGAALQRFGSDVTDPVRQANRNTIADRARSAAERTGRGFYVEYDVSGLTDANLEQTLKTDWTDSIKGKLKLTDSPAYAKEDGKPVVELWGFGFTNRPGSAEQAKRVVDWFKDQGVYVIGGVPRGWETDAGAKPGFRPVYDSFDMLSPWMVGSTADTAPQLAADKKALDANGQDYQPVVYPGFAWSNWKEGSKRNEIPRSTGDYLWTQAAKVRAAGVNQAFIAMFDEYDEGTAIAPAASDSSMIPTDQYFLTTSADGKYTDPDFYLRLAGSATRMITGQDPYRTTVPIPLADGPVMFRSSVEQDVDAQPDGPGTPLPGGSLNLGTDTSFGVRTGADHGIGRSALRLAGTTPQAGHSYAYFQAFDVNIPVKDSSSLSYAFLPKNDGGRNISVDFLMTDGSTLRGSAAKTSTGQPMHPGTAKGTVGSWTTVRSDFGPALAGKTVDKILVGYDRGGSAAPGPFEAYVDDVAITQ